MNTIEIIINDSKGKPQFTNEYSFSMVQYFLWQRTRKDTVTLKTIVKQMLILYFEKHM